MPRDIVEHVGELVKRGCQLCQSAMRAEGIKVLALMSRDVAQMAHIECHIERAKWERILDVCPLWPCAPSLCALLHALKCPWLDMTLRPFACGRVFMVG